MKQRSQYKLLFFAALVAGLVLGLVVGLLLNRSHSPVNGCNTYYNKDGTKLLYTECN